MQFCRISKLGSAGRRPTVVGTGLVALDVLLHADIGTVDTALGGSAGNVLAILGHLGWKSVPVAQLGADHAAEEIWREFAKLGADTRFLWRVKENCTPVIFQLPATGESTHTFSFRCPACGRKRAFIPPSLDQKSSALLGEVAAPDVFYFDRVTPWALELAERYRDQGTLVVFEPSLIGSDHVAFARALRATHVLKYADERILDLEQFDRSSLDVEVQTQGKIGLRFRSGNLSEIWHTLNAFQVPYVEDTAGAGDWCTAGFLFALIGSIFEKGGKGLVSTRRVRESLRFGQVLAALNCMEIGARGLARHFSHEEIVTLAASIRNASATPAAAGDNAQSPRLAPTSHLKITATALQSSFLCCEALAD
jgi:fructokinase